MSATTRLKHITDIVQNNKRVSVTELSEICNVTEETIRKDLTKLESAGILTRVHGGAVLNEQSQSLSIQFDQRKKIEIEGKRTIAKNVQFLFEDGISLFADGSSTVSEALAAIDENKDVMIISNSANLFFDMADKKARLISTGGLFNSRHLSLQGNVTKETICKYHADYALISCKTIDLDRGVQDSDEGEAEVKEMMINQSDKVILLVDHTKFNKHSLIRLLDLDKLAYIITDVKPSQEWIEYCIANNIKLVY